MIYPCGCETDDSYTWRTACAAHEPYQRDPVNGGNLLTFVKRHVRFCDHLPDRNRLPMT